MGQEPRFGRHDVETMVGPRAQSAPEIGLIHHLACSGGTVFARALAAMPGIVMLSEQHPEQAMARRTDPLKQAQAAGAPVTESDVSERFARDIGLVARRCADSQRRLIVRDHANRDFIGTDHFRLRTREVLSDVMPVRSICTVRHPVDTWLSLQASGWFKGSVQDFLGRYEAFAACAIDLGFERYEDFAEDPDAVLERACKVLAVSYDAEWQSRIQDVTHMTGNSGRASENVVPRARRGAGPELIREFESCRDYPRVLDTLGYEPAKAREAA